MGSLRRKTHLKPVPEGAELFKKRVQGVTDPQRFASWITKSGKKTARIKTLPDGAIRVVIETGRWLASYVDASGRTREVSTDCREKQEAEKVLDELVHRAKLIRTGVVTEEEDAIADPQATAMVEHFEAYRTHMLSRGLSAAHIGEVSRYLRNLADDCGFTRLSDIRGDRLDRWIADRRSEQMGARTLNCYLAAWKTFMDWCVGESRTASNPFSRISKADEKADRRRQRRSMTETELGRLLYVARWRPLAEYGRERVFKTPAEGKRTSWTNTPLTFETIDLAIEQARLSLSENPDLIEKLELRGKERQLIYKTMVMTGLRKKELTLLKLRNLDLDCDPPYLTLDAANEKNREGNSIPLRADLADDLRDWLIDRLTSRQEAVRNPAIVSFQTEAARLQGTVSGESDASRLSSDEPLFKVPSSLLTVLNRDLKAAGIPKCDDRGRTLDVHALRHTFGTHLSKAGVPLRTAQAAMRHSSPVLTANIYTDPRLLDVQGAVESLPAFSSDAPEHDCKQIAATGTERSESISTSGHSSGNSARTVHSESQTGNFGELTESNPDRRIDSKNSDKPTKKARILSEKDSGQKSGRHDLNMRLPAPKAGALPS
jgi:integrase